MKACTSVSALRTSTLSTLIGASRVMRSTIYKATGYTPSVIGVEVPLVVLERAAALVPDNRVKGAGETHVRYGGQMEMHVRVDDEYTLEIRSEKRR